MSTSFVSLLPFLAALQRKPGTPQDQDESKPSPARAKPAQIPLGGAPPPPGVPANAFDQHKIKSLTVQQVAGVILGENGSGAYKVEPLPGRSTAEDLKKAKIAQAHAVINGDRQLGVNRPQTAGWQTTEAQRNTPEYQQALEAARAAYQEDNLGIDPSGGRTHFNNRFEGDVGEHEEFLRKDRVVRDNNGHAVGLQKVNDVHGPFTVGGGRVWTLIYDDTRPIDRKNRTTVGKTAPVK
jgi:hypothetical protein